MHITRRRDQSNFIPIGDYTPPEADRLLEALTTAKIPFEIECDDGISDQPNTSGTFGTNAYVSVFVSPQEKVAAKKIHTELFGDKSP